MPDNAAKKPRKRAVAQPAPKEKLSETVKQQPDETDKQYHAFCVYRDLGINRKLKLVQIETGIADKLLRHWAEAFSWEERANEYDEYLAERRRIASEQEILRMVERHNAIATEMQEAVAWEIETARKAQKAGNSSLTPADVAKWVEVAAKLERLTRGLPSRISEDRSTIDQRQAVKIEVEYINDWRNAVAVDSLAPSTAGANGQGLLPAPSHDTSLEDDDREAPAAGITAEEVQRNRRAWTEREKPPVALSASENTITPTQAAIIMATPRRPKMYLD